MANCKRCSAPINWRKHGDRFVALNSNGSLHKETCTATPTCRYCEKPVVWKDHEGKRQCFEPDGVTLHNDSCPNKNQCTHCRAQINWVSVEGKWLAFDCMMPEMLHWSVCVRNPEGARATMQYMATMTRELQRLRALVAEQGTQLPPGAPSTEVESLRLEVARLRREMASNQTHHERELRYRDVELHRLTQKLRELGAA